MIQYTFIYRSGEAEMSPDEMQAHLAQIIDWFKDLKARGHITDPGSPLAESCRIVSGKQRSIHDGPFAEAKDLISGFTMSGPATWPKPRN